MTVALVTQVRSTGACTAVRCPTWPAGAVMWLARGRDLIGVRMRCGCVRARVVIRQGSCVQRSWYVALHCFRMTPRASPLVLCPLVRQLLVAHDACPCVLAQAGFTTRRALDYDAVRATVVLPDGAQAFTVEFNMADTTVGQLKRIVRARIPRACLSTARA